MNFQIKLTEPILWTKKMRMKALFISCFLFILMMVNVKICQPYIDANHIDAFRLVDTLSSFLIVPTLMSLLLATTYKIRYTMVANVGLGCLVSFMFRYIWSSSRDCSDVIAIIVSGILTWCVLEIVIKRYKTCHNE